MIKEKSNWQFLHHKDWETSRTKTDIKRNAKQGYIDEFTVRALELGGAYCSCTFTMPSVDIYGTTFDKEAISQCVRRILKRVNKKYLKTANTRFGKSLASFPTIERGIAGGLLHSHVLLQVPPRIEGNEKQVKDFMMFVKASAIDEVYHWWGKEYPCQVVRLLSTQDDVERCLNYVCKMIVHDDNESYCVDIRNLVYDKFIQRNNPPTPH